MKIYIACGLTHVPRVSFGEYVLLIQTLAARLAGELKAEVKYALKDSDPQLASKPVEDRAKLCYAWDREMVESADLVVAECSYPSTGLGIELQIAQSSGIPALVCFNLSDRNAAIPTQYVGADKLHHALQIGEGYVSLMALGLPNIVGVLGYGTNDDACDQICRSVAGLVKRT